MWQSQTETIDNGVLIRLQSDNEPLSFATLFAQLANNVGFISWYNELLAGSNLVSFFWEHPPLTNQRLDDAAEFVLLEAPALTGMRADQTSFADQFEAAPAEPVLVFDNLGGDARLIVPNPTEGTQSCAHLAPFVRGADARLVCAFWQTLGKTVLYSMSDTPLWLSTSGLGISWLHARLDARPKYYQHAAYKNGAAS